MVQFRFKELLAAKERREGRKITYRIVKAETGINLNSVTAIANNRATRVDLETIDRLCKYLDCTPGELLVLGRE